MAPHTAEAGPRTTSISAASSGSTVRPWSAEVEARSPVRCPSCRTRMRSPVRPRITGMLAPGPAYRDEIPGCEACVCATLVETLRASSRPESCTVERATRSGSAPPGVAVTCNPSSRRAEGRRTSRTSGAAPSAGSSTSAWAGA